MKHTLLTVWLILSIGNVFADISGIQDDNTPLGMDPIFEHGNLVFNRYQFKASENFLVKENIRSSKKTWSGWWFPSRDREMFDMGTDNHAPLQIYDLLFEELKSLHNGNQRTLDKYYLKLFQKWPQSNAIDYFSNFKNYTNNFGVNNTVEFEERFFYSSNESSWDGLCEGVAFASILEEEPKNCRLFQTVKGEKIYITPFHMKALLAKKYDFLNTGINYYGNKFIYRPWKTNVSGPVDDYSDINPMQFHRLLHYYMRDRKQNLIIDYDASFPVWNVSVFGYDSFIVDEGGTLKVKTNIYYSDPLDRDILIGHPGDYKLHFSGTNDNIIELYYELDYVTSGSNYVITASRWTEGPGTKSFINHPDYVIALDPSKVVPASAGDTISPEIVDFIVNGLPEVQCPQN